MTTVNVGHFDSTYSKMYDKLSMVNYKCFATFLLRTGLVNPDQPYTVTWFSHLLTSFGEREAVEGAGKRKVGDELAINCCMQVNGVRAARRSNVFNVGMKLNSVCVCVCVWGWL